MIKTRVERTSASAARGKDLCAIVYRLGPPRGARRTSRIELTGSQRLNFASPKNMNNMFLEFLDVPVVLTGKHLEQMLCSACCSNSSAVVFDLLVISSGASESMCKHEVPD